MKKTTRILIVEDNGIIATEIRQILLCSGYEVISVVASGERAVEAVEKDLPDVVLMDITLPGTIDGIEATKQIRASHDIPVIYLSVHSDKDVIDRAKVTEPQGYLLKPIQENELQIAIEMALHRHKIETTLKETNRRLEYEIVQRKQTEVALQQLKKAVETMYIGVTITDLDRKILYTNPAEAKMHGYQPKELVGKDVSILIPAERRKPMTLEQIRMMKTWVRESVNTRKDGSMFPVQLISDVVKNSQQAPIAIVTACEEITERKQMEEALRNSEVRFRTISELVSDYAYVFCVEPEGWIVREWVTEAFTRITGYTPEEVDVRGGWIQLVHPEDKNIAIRHRQAFLSGNETISEYRIITKNGDIFWLRDYSRPVWDEDLGRVVRVFGAAQDITKRKQAENQLRQFWHRLEFLLNVSPAGIYTCKTEGNFCITFISDNVKKLFGYEPREFVANPDFWAEHIHPDDKQGVFAKRSKIFETGHYTQEYRFLNKEGEYRWVRDELILIQGENGHPLEIIGSWSNITELKQVEAALRKAKETAEAANQAKSDFLANMSHELRTPLNAILGYTQILSRDESLTDKQRNAIEIMQRSGDHLLSMISEILDFAKIEAQKFELEPATFHLPSFLKSIAEMVQIWAYRKGITFTADVTSDLPPMMHGDEKRLRQILINLLSNAVKFTEKGRVVFRVTRCGLKDPESESGIHLSQPAPRTFRLASRIRFEVEDSGIGIPPEQIKNIFLPFEQVGERPLHKEGAGLGLAISQKLVQMMGSELQVQSTVAKGSMFWFDLEFPESAQSRVEGPQISSSRHIVGFKGNPRKILIVDDKTTNRVVLKDMLLPVGFEVIEAVDGHDAIEKAREFYPDLILMDLIMPGMDGFEATRRIRKLETGNWKLETRDQQLTSSTQHPAPSTQHLAPSTQHPAPSTQHPVIIAISASAFEQTKEKSIVAGCHDFVAKPISKQHLLDKLQTYLKLEWIYDDISDVGYRTSDIRSPEFAIRDSQSKIHNEPHLAENSIILPPKEELTRLNKLAMIGDIMEIRERIEIIDNLDPQFATFAEKFRKLAKDLNILEIQRSLEQYIDG